MTPCRNFATSALRGLNTAGSSFHPSNSSTRAGDIISVSNIIRGGSFSHHYCDTIGKSGLRCGWVPEALSVK